MSAIFDWHGDTVTIDWIQACVACPDLAQYASCPASSPELFERLRDVLAPYARLQGYTLEQVRVGSGAPAQFKFKRNTTIH